MKRYLLFLVLSFFTFVLPASADEGNYIAESPLMSNLGLFDGNTFETKVEGNTVTVNVIDNDMIGETLRVYKYTDFGVKDVSRILIKKLSYRICLADGSYLIQLGKDRAAILIQCSNKFKR